MRFQLLQLATRADQRAQHHVAADSGETIEVGDLHFATLTRLDPLQAAARSEFRTEITIGIEGDVSGATWDCQFRVGREKFSGTDRLQISLANMRGRKEGEREQERAPCLARPRATIKSERRAGLRHSQRSVRPRAGAGTH